MGDADERVRPEVRAHVVDDVAGRNRLSERPVRFDFDGFPVQVHDVGGKPQRLAADDDRQPVPTREACQRAAIRPAQALPQRAEAAQPRRVSNRLRRPSEHRGRVKNHARAATMRVSPSAPAII